MHKHFLLFFLQLQNFIPKLILPNQRHCLNKTTEIVFMGSLAYTQFIFVFSVTCLHRATCFNRLIMGFSNCPQPGAAIPSGPCEECMCSESSPSKPQHPTVRCQPVICDTYCPLVSAVLLSEIPGPLSSSNHQLRSVT